MDRNTDSEIAQSAIDGFNGKLQDLVHSLRNHPWTETRMVHTSKVLYDLAKAVPEPGVPYFREELCAATSAWRDASKQELKKFGEQAFSNSIYAHHQLGVQPDDECRYYDI